MSTVAIYNGFGGYEKYEVAPGVVKKGVLLHHGGVPFFFPFEEVTYIPDFTMREVDHNASTADKEEESILTYKTFPISGQRIAEELLETQVPYPNSSRGFLVVEPDRSKYGPEHKTILSGFTEDGRKLFTEVQEIVPSETDVATAKRLARIYKEQMVQDYFQSKRERMAGGHGQIFPTGMIRVYMEELGVKDIDDVSRHVSQAPDMNAALSQFFAFLQNVAPKPDSTVPPAPPVPPTPPPADTPVEKSAADGLI